MNDNIRRILTQLAKDNGYEFLYEDNDAGVSRCGICGQEATHTYHEGIVARHREDCLVRLAQKELKADS